MNRRGMLGEVSKKISLFSEDYNIDYNGWYVSGDFLGWEYVVSNSRRTIASISKKVISFGDSYEIDVENAGDVAEVLMLVLAIDAANERK